MNEGKATRERTAEYIDDDIPFEYLKYRFIDHIKYKFYLRFIKKHFTPCDECQTKLHTLITESDDLILGNKDYDPLIELNRTWKIIKETEIERRKATKEDYKRIYGYRWENYWKAYVEGE